MLYGKYRFTCRFENEALLPEYKGSTLRGVLGIALKRVVCALRRQECPTCLLKNTCLYVRLFETHLSADVPEGARVSAPPHPFVLEPPLEDDTRYESGSTLDCAVLLFGDANRHLPYLVYAFDQIGEVGIGRRINGVRGRFRLEEVRSGDRVLYAADTGKLIQADCAEDLSASLSGALAAPNPDPAGGERREANDPADFGDAPERPGRLKVVLETPLRLKFRNRLHPELPFHVLVRAALRRVSSLFSVYGQGEPPLDYKGLVERAEDVCLVENHLTWFDWERYSNRQECRMLMGGMVGSAEYQGRLEAYLPLLDVAAKVHLGKNTSFGLGKVMVEAEA